MPTTDTASGDSNRIQANARKHYDITRADLPLCCPMKNMSLWDSHPRVYLALDDNGRALCPYCSAEYVLKD
ncbi:MAG TPA: zinc-finger domain-containing protein [Gammaproteobacteria bacterium]|nr:zinc-finger domain-containing protein [Gammaproteobacteria bacterium]